MARMVAEAAGFCNGLLTRGARSVISVPGMMLPGSLFSGSRSLGACVSEHFRSGRIVAARTCAVRAPAALRCGRGAACVTPLNRSDPIRVHRDAGPPAVPGAPKVHRKPSLRCRHGLTRCLPFDRYGVRTQTCPVLRHVTAASGRNDPGPSWDIAGIRTVRRLGRSGGLDSARRLPHPPGPARIGCHMHTQELLQCLPLAQSLSCSHCSSAAELM